jgi:mannosyltransferase
MLLPTVTLLLTTLVKPLYVDRYVLYSMVGLALVTGAALERLWLTARSRKRNALMTVSAIAALVALGPLGLHQRSPESRTDDVQAVAVAVHEAASPGDGLLFTPARRRVWASANTRAFDGLRDLALAQSPLASHTLYGTEVSAQHIRARMLASPRIVVLTDPAGQPLDTDPRETVKRAVLRSYFTQCDTNSVHGARITVYARPGRC